MLMSPFKTFISCGISSIRAALKKCPTLVTRGSFSEASTGPLSCSALSTMVLNLYRKKGFPCRVRRFCRYKTGPRESSLTTMPTSTLKGAVRARATRESAISVTLLKNIDSSEILKRPIVNTGTSSTCSSLAWASIISYKSGTRNTLTSLSTQAYTTLALCSWDSVEQTKT